MYIYIYIYDKYSKYNNNFYLITTRYNLGESFYNPYLQNIINDLLLSGQLKESDGAQCIFVDGYINSGMLSFYLYMYVIQNIMFVKV